MKRFYFRFRVMLIMFALGLASVGFFNSVSDYLTEIPVDLPKVQNGSPIFVFPREKKSLGPAGGSGGCGAGNYSKKQKNKTH